MKQISESSNQMRGPNQSAPASEELIISNEFAEVRVKSVWTHNGIRLEIASQKLGWKVYLDALQLESLTWQPPERYSTFLIEPFGPSKGPATAIVDSRLDQW